MADVVDGAAMSKKEKIEHILAHADEAFIAEHKMKGQLKNLVKQLNAKQVDTAFDLIVNGPARAAAAAAAAAIAAGEKAEADAAAAAKLAEQRAARAALKAEEDAAAAERAARAEREEESGYASRMAAERIAFLRAAASKARLAQGLGELALERSAAAAALAAAAAVSDCGLAGLPGEALAHVCSFLGPTDAVRLGSACARLRAAILLEPTLWTAVDMRAVEPEPARTDAALGALATLAQGALAELDASGCGLLSRGAVAGVAVANPALHTLRAVGLSGGSAWSLEQLAAVRAACPALRELEADAWVDSVKALGGGVLRSRTLPRIAGLKIRTIGPADAAEAARACGGAPWLGSLVLEGSSAHSLGTAGGGAFAAALAPRDASAAPADAGLRRLELPRCYILDEGVGALCEALRAQPQLRELALASNTLRNAGAEALRALLATPECAVHTLDLRYNEIGALGAPRLGALLCQNNSLTSLDLRFNGIDNFGIIALAQGLEGNTALLHLNLTGNLCQIGGAERLGEALGVNHTLRTLELDSNRLTAKGAVALATGLLKNRGLRKLTVGGNSVKAGAKKFASALTVHPTLGWLELGANNIDDDCCDELSWALASAECALTHLDLSRNDLTSACCEELAEALRANRTLRSLDVATCRIDDEGAAQLKDALETNASLRTLDLTQNVMSALFVQRHLADLKARICANFQRVETEASDDDDDDADAKPADEAAAAE